MYIFGVVSCPSPYSGQPQDPDGYVRVRLDSGELKVTWPRTRTVDVLGIFGTGNLATNKVPSGYVEIATENGQLYWNFPLKMVDLSIVM